MPNEISPAVASVLRSAAALGLDLEILKPVRRPTLEGFDGGALISRFLHGFVAIRSYILLSPVCVGVCHTLYQRVPPLVLARSSRGV